MPTPTPPSADRSGPFAESVDLIALSRILDAATDRLVGRLAARVQEWTTSPVEQSIIARLATEAAQSREAKTGSIPSTANRAP
jgi:hypothetical protein